MVLELKTNKAFGQQPDGALSHIHIHRETIWNTRTVERGAPQYLPILDRILTRAERGDQGLLHARDLSEYSRAQ